MNKRVALILVLAFLAFWVVGLVITPLYDPTAIHQDGGDPLTANWDVGNFTIIANGLTIDGTFTDGTALLTGGAWTGLTSLVVGSLTISDGVANLPYIVAAAGEMRLYPDDLAQSRYLKLTTAGTLLTLEAGGTPGATDLKIIASSGDIDFDDENLQTTGNLTDGTNSLTIANAKDAYTHSQDNSQAHTDYLINDGNDTTSGILTAAGLIIDNLSIDGSSILVDSNASGILTLGGTGGTFNENLTLDFEAVNNKVEINSGTGVTAVRWRLHQFFLDNKYFSFGSGDDARILWQTTGKDSLKLGLRLGNDAYTGYFSIMERADVGVADRSPLAVATDPTLRIYSADETSATDYIEFYHDQNDGVIATGVGNLNLNPASHVAIKSNKELRFYDNGNYVGFEAPALSADQIWVLPTADGSADEIIKTNGSGVLSFTRMPKAIYAELSDSTDQEFAVVGEPNLITFDTNDEIAGIIHSTSSNPENITIVTTGVYTIFAQPQVAAGSGGAGTFHMWLQKNTGGGFVDIANTNIELSLASGEEDVIPLATTFMLSAGDIIRLSASVSDIKIKLDAQTPANEPVIPSIIFTMFMIGV